MKICSTCKDDKSFSEFYKNISKPDGLTLQCKPCSKAGAKRRRLANIDHHLAKEREYRERNIDVIRMRALAWHHANKPPLLERKPALTPKQYYAKNRELELARCSAWRAENKEKRRDITRRYYEQNKDKVNATTLAWRIKNPGASNAITARRRASKKIASPSWANSFFIKEAYALAALRTKMLGFKWNVDHIVPIQSPLVCGLHCEANLQVITKYDNVRKGNRVWPDMPGSGKRTYEI